MVPVDPTSLRELLEAVIAGFSVLGEGMACFSGYLAAAALAGEQPPEIVAQRVNAGVGLGFGISSPISIMVLIIMAWS